MASPLGMRAALVVVLCALAVPARADSARAEELIRQGNELRRQGKDTEAVPLYREAYEVARSPRTAAQLGLVEHALGYWLDAEAHLSEALAPASHPWVDRNRKVLETTLATVRAHVGSLTIEGKPAGAEVRVDRRLIGTFPLSGPIRVAEGNVKLEVSAVEYFSQERAIQMTGGAKQREWFDLAMVPKTVGKKIQDPPDVVTPPQLSTWRRVLPWALAGGAAVAGGIAVWQHVEWRDAQSRFDEIPACAAGDPNRGTDGRCEGLYNTLAGHRRGSIVGYAAAGALGIGAAVTFFMNAGEPSAKEASVVPAAGPTALGLSLRGRF